MSVSFEGNGGIHPAVNPMQAPQPRPIWRTLPCAGVLGVWWCQDCVERRKPHLIAREDDLCAICLRARLNSPSNCRSERDGGQIYHNSAMSRFGAGGQVEGYRSAGRVVLRSIQSPHRKVPSRSKPEIRWFDQTVLPYTMPVCLKWKDSADQNLGNAFHPMVTHQPVSLL